MIEKTVGRHLGGEFFTYNGTIYRRFESAEKRIRDSFKGKEVGVSTLDMPSWLSNYIAEKLASGEKRCADEGGTR